MNGGRHLPQDDLALFALQLLEGDELEQALDHLEVCEDCRHDVARFQGDLVGYTLANTPLHTPPAAARERLLKAVAKERKFVPERTVAPLRRSSAAVPVARTSTAQIPVAHDPLEPLEPGPVFHPTAEAREREPEAADDHDGELFLASRGRRIFEAEPREEETLHRTPRRSNPLAAALAWTGWAAAAGLAIAAGMQYRDRQNLQGEFSAQTAALARANSSLDEAESALHTLTDSGAMQVSLHVPPPASGAPPAEPEGHAAYDARSGSLVFIADHLQPLVPGKTYELWLLPPDKNAAPVPAGLFKPDARGVASVMMPDIPKGMPALGFGVTIEDDGGSQKPTMPVVMMGL